MPDMPENPVALPKNAVIPGETEADRQDYIEGQTGVTKHSAYDQGTIDRMATLRMGLKQDVQNNPVPPDPAVEQMKALLARTEKAKAYRLRLWPPFLRRKGGETVQPSAPNGTPLYVGPTEKVPTSSEEVEVAGLEGQDAEAAYALTDYSQAHVLEESAPEPVVHEAPTPPPEQERIAVDWAVPGPEASRGDTRYQEWEEKYQVLAHAFQNSIPWRPIKDFCDAAGFRQYPKSASIESAYMLSYQLESQPFTLQDGTQATASVRLYRHGVGEKAKHFMLVEKQWKSSDGVTHVAMHVVDGTTVNTGGERGNPPVSTYPVASVRENFDITQPGANTLAQQLEHNTKLRDILSEHRDNANSAQQPTNQNLADHFIRWFIQSDNKVQSMNQNLFGWMPRTRTNTYLRSEGKDVEAILNLPYYDKTASHSPFDWLEFVPASNWRDRIPEAIKKASPLEAVAA